MPELTEKLKTLFQNSAAVLQRAGFSKSLDEIKAMPHCYMNTIEIAEEAEESRQEIALRYLYEFVKNLDVTDKEKARSSFLQHFKIINDGHQIFAVPTCK